MTTALPTQPRIDPLAPPYAPEIEALLNRMTPPGAPEPLKLFRTWAHHPVLAERMRSWGGYLLGTQARLALRQREVVILRACALCGCEYEWGVHVAAFAQQAGFTQAELDAVSDPQCGIAALPEAERALVCMVDELHAQAGLSDAGWQALRTHFDIPTCMEALMLAGWYRAIAGFINAVGVPLESWQARFHLQPA